MNITKKKRIVIIEPSPIVRKGLKSLIEENSTEFVIEFLYDDLKTCQDNLHKSLPDIILVNPSIVTFYRQFNIRHILSDCPNTLIVAILYGYVDSETLNSFDGILDIYDNGSMLIKKLKAYMKDVVKSQKNSSGDAIELSEREIEILVSVAKGMTNKEIADSHYISVHTVISHRKNITRKTGIKTVSGLTVYAIFNNLLSREDLL